MSVTCQPTTDESTTGFLTQPSNPATATMRVLHVAWAKDLGEQLHKVLGIRFSVCSAAGTPVGDQATPADSGLGSGVRSPESGVQSPESVAPDSRLQTPDPQLPEPSAERIEAIVRRAVETAEPVTETAPEGIVTLAVPICFRRQVVGVSVGSYLATEALASPALERLAASAGLTVDDAKRTFGAAALYSQSAAPRLAETVRLIHTLRERELVKEREIAELTDNLLSTYEEISLLYKVSTSIRVASSPIEIIDLILTELLVVLEVETVAAVDVAQDDGEWAPQRTLVAGERALDPKSLQSLCALYERKWQEGGRPYIENHCRDVADVADAFPHLDSVMLVPLLCNDEVLSIIVAVNKQGGQEFGSNDAKLVSSLASETALHLKNSQLYEDMRGLLYSVIRALSSAIDAKDPYTCGHSERVAFIARSIAERMHLPPAGLEAIYLSGLLHDVGKIGISEDVLGKPGKLTEEETAHVRSHPEIGARILGSLKQLKDILPGVRFHHERMDGKGYPLGLAGEEIPLVGRVIAVADGYDSMTSDRPYRTALPQEVAIAEITRCTGTQYDPTIVAVFLDLIEEPHFRDIYRNMSIESVITGGKLT